MPVHMTAMNILNDEKKVSTIVLRLPRKSQLWIGELRGQCSGKGMSDFTTLEKTWVKFVYISVLKQ